MEQFKYYAPTKILFGKNTEAEVGELCKTQGASKVLVHFGGSSAKKSGLLDRVCGALQEAGLHYVTLGGVVPNPRLSKVYEGIEICRREKVDFILAVGGGSVMDCSKAISLGAVYDGDLWDAYWAHAGKIETKPIPLGIVLTVSGTGSETNGGSVITNESLKVKTGRDYPELNAQFAILNPKYTETVPKFQFISGAFDSLSHMMEIYFSEPNDNNVSDVMNEALMRSAVDNIRAILVDPHDEGARSNLVWLATMAENRILKLGKKTDFQCHILEHSLGAYTFCNHGAGLAVLHPVYYRHIVKDGTKKFARFAEKVFDIDPSEGDELTRAQKGIEALTAFIKEIGLPTRLRDMNIDHAVLVDVAAGCVASPGSFRQLGKEEIREIFEEAY